MGGAGRVVIVNADDLGLSPSVNAGVIEARERGILTSASVMVLRPAAADGCRRAARTGLGLGLHLELDDPDDIAVEMRRQLDRFRELAGRDPDHLDSHHHVHIAEPFASAAAELADELGVPLRARGPGIAYRADFYGQTAAGGPRPAAITPERLAGLIGGLAPGITELGCHPGIGVTAAESSYNSEREREVASLCDPRVRAAVERERVSLRTFADLTTT